MPTQEERIAALEQTTISRIDFLNSVNRLALQQAQSANDTYHELTILLGVTGSQGQDIKAIKEDVGAIKERLGSVETTLSERLGSVETTLSEHTALLTQILTRLPEKP
jgi:hypothetical protein